MAVIWMSLLLPVAATAAVALAFPVTCVVGYAVVKIEKRRRRASKSQNESSPGPQRTKTWLPRWRVQKRRDSTSPASEQIDLAPAATETQVIEPKQP